ncbi:hypothetical protein LPJ61_003476, partial [Coemansia biformis]
SLVPDAVRVLDIEFSREPLATARALGVSNEQMRSIIQASPHTRSVLKVSRILQVRPKGVDSLEIGDIVIGVNGSTIGHIDDVACFYDCDSVNLTVIRRGEELSLAIPVLPLRGTATRRVVHWAGMYLQEPYQRILQQATRVTSQVFNFMYIHGGPAVLESHHSNMFITEISGEPVQTLDDVVRIASKLKSNGLAEFNNKVANNEMFANGAMPGCDVKIRTVLLNGEDVIKTIRTNDHYFPAWQLTRGPRIDDEWIVEEL